MDSFDKLIDPTTGIVGDISDMQMRFYDTIIKNSINKTNGRLTAILYDPNHYLKDITINPNANKSKTLICRCKCGNVLYVRNTDFTTNKIRSCGCWHDENAKKLNSYQYKHGDTHTRLYNILWGMIRRCYNEHDDAYDRYGGRGIYICDEWYTPENHTIGWLKFKEWALKNGYHDPLPDDSRSSSLTIDRKDNDGPYAPWNCRWIPMRDQITNTSKTKFIRIYGRKYSVPDWGRVIHIDPGVITRRITEFGWDEQDAATIPTREIREMLGYKSDIYSYDGPRYDKHGDLRDRDGFIILIKKNQKGRI